MSFSDFQDAVNQARAESVESRLNLKTARQRYANTSRQEQRLSRGIPAKEAGQNPELNRLEQQKREYAESVSTSKQTFNDKLISELDKFREFEQFTNPINNISSLDDNWPILLFPLRLETRFKKVRLENRIVDQLWVRIFPDDIAINSFESDLSDTEIQNARTYWVTRWNAGKKIDGNRAAWRALASTHGPGRAYWLVTGDRIVPENVDQEPDIEADLVILAIGTDTPLVDPEQSLIMTYWEAVWRANNDKQKLDVAWDNLVADTNQQRAEELVEDYHPINLKVLPPSGFDYDSTRVKIDFVIFKKADEVDAKLHGWSQPPTTSILPERFVFLAYHHGEQDMDPQIGNLVPPELILGPDPAAEEGEELRLATAEDVAANPELSEGDLIYSENMHWMFDFEEAVNKGMGFRIDLTPEQAERGFDRVMVLGVKLSANRETGQNKLQELFKQHQFSRKGMSILRQGTPTNNTEDEGAGYSWKHDPDDSFDHYFLKDFEPTDSDTTAISDDWFTRPDGYWLADMLGILRGSIENMPNFLSRDISHGLSMQKALWPATMGHFMESMMNPVFSDEIIELTRLFFTRLVNGRGLVPAIRVGKQPYGILPANNYTNMSWFKSTGGDHTLAFSAANAFSRFNYLEQLYKILMDIDKVWSVQQNRVSYIGKAGQDAHQLLLDIVGLHPDSAELYHRYANTIKQLHNILNVNHYIHPSLGGIAANSNVAASLLLLNYGYVINKENPAPKLFDLSFFNDSYPLKGNMVDSIPPSETDPLQNTTTTNTNYIQWLIDVSRFSHHDLTRQRGFKDNKPPDELLYIMLHHALDLSFVETSIKAHQAKGLMTKQQVQQSRVEPDLIHVQQAQESESRWKHLYKVEERITGDPQLLMGAYIAQNIDILDEAASFREVLSSLETLKTVETAKLERAMMEHIDTVSYRYDAWVTGFLNLQLAHMRGLSIPWTTSGQSDSEEEPALELSSRDRGIYLGAYGWLEDLRPEDKQLTPVKLPDDLKAIFNPDNDLVEDDKNAGYILAPSQNHAITAAVLRNGFISNEDENNREALNIKLTSDRVRRAMGIIEGIQAGQTLSALLGYQFERGLHDRTDANVDQYILELRNQFPLASKNFKETTPEDDEYDSVSQIEARNVIDGVAFINHLKSLASINYPFDLSIPAANNNTDRIALNEEANRLIELNDAVSDLALAESVHQVVLGNYETAKATMDTYSKGNFPPTPDVIRTPRSGTVLTHRVALHFKRGAGYNIDDLGVTPRMVAEPAIHDWLVKIMPAINQIECVVKFHKLTTDTEAEIVVNMQAIGLNLIDVLYLLNNDGDQAMTSLDDLIVHHVMGIGDIDIETPIKIEYARSDSGISLYEVSSQVASLRELLLKSRPLSPADAKISVEASKAQEQVLSVDTSRLNSVRTRLQNYINVTGDLTVLVNDLKTLVTNDVTDDLVTSLDTVSRRVADLFIEIGQFGMPQTGIGFVYQWQQSMLMQLKSRLDEVISRYEQSSMACSSLLTEYVNAVAAGRDEQEQYQILSMADLKISSVSTQHSHAAPADYAAQIQSKLVDFDDFRDNQIRPIRALQSLTIMVTQVLALQAQIDARDIIGLDITPEIKQIRIFISDLHIGASNLSQAIKKKTDAAADFLGSASTEADALKQIDLVRSAARQLLGDDFVVLPDFELTETHKNEWQNAYDSSGHSLRFLENVEKIDFPMDDWMHGVSRVRDKMYHLENVIYHTEGFIDSTLILTPLQFPYRNNDYWLGMKHPETVPDPEDPTKEIPFTIEEDKLLFTSLYADGYAFEKNAKQCGILIDEWTEVIPTKSETPGLSFHYDQPNTEPPQTLLLATPSQNAKTWQWDDLVNTLHETLEMAKKRAVEPEQINDTVYAKFLPAIISLTLPVPITSGMNVAVNNKVGYKEVSFNV